MTKKELTELLNDAEDNTEISFFFKNNEKESPRMSSTIYRMPGKQMKFDEKSGKLVSSIIFSNFESKGINNELK